MSQLFTVLPVALPVLAVVYHILQSAGEFGVVYRGNLTGWRSHREQSLVAVKTLKGMEQYQHSSV